jgi:hypothetical protein
MRHESLISAFHAVVHVDREPAEPLKRVEIADVNSDEPISDGDPRVLRLEQLAERATQTRTSPTEGAR